MEQKIGRYNKVEEIGRGGHAVVYRGLDTRLNRTVAIKVIYPSLTNDSEFLARFKREAEVAANLQHPHVVPVYDYGEDNGRFFLVMRFMEGGSLADLLKQGPLTWERTIQIATDIASGLDFIHGQGIVHRDVKPANILLDGNGRAVLSDFGIVRAMEHTTLVQSSAGGILGTPAYIAPEIWNGETAVPATDQYALACTVYEMVMGKRLFNGETPAAIMAQHHKPLNFTIEQQPVVSHNFAQTLKKALAQSPSNRYPSIQHFITAFDRSTLSSNSKKSVVQFPLLAGNGYLKAGAIISTVILIGLLLFAGYMQISNGKNQPPQISNLTTNRKTIQQGESTYITVIASDSDNDTLSYSWSTEYGTVPQGNSGPQIEYTAPQNYSGFDKVWVTVSDGVNETTDYLLIAVQLVN